MNFLGVSSPGPSSMCLQSVQSVRGRQSPFPDLSLVSQDSWLGVTGAQSTWLREKEDFLILLRENYRHRLQAELDPGVHALVSAVTL